MLRWGLIFLLTCIVAKTQVLDEEAIVNYPLMKDLKEYPVDCWFSGGNNCLIKTDFHSKYPIRINKTSLVLGSETALLKREGVLHFVAGELWIKGNIDVQTELGKIYCKNCEAYLFRKKNEVYARSLDGALFIEPLNSQKKLLVPRYTENWMAGVSIKKKVGESGIPKPISFRDHVKVWAKFYKGTKSEFKVAVEDFQRKWAFKVHESSNEYKLRSKRKISSVEKQIEKRKEAKEKEKEANRVFREMLRRRALYE